MSPNSQRSAPSITRPIHPPPDGLPWGVGDPTVLVVRADQVRSPTSNKKGGRECRQQQGEEHVVNAGGYQQHHLLQAVSGAVGALYEPPKKRRGPTPSQYDASSPHRRERVQVDGRNTYGSSPSRQNVTAVRQPRKRSGPTRSPHDAFPSPYGWLP